MSIHQYSRILTKNFGDNIITEVFPEYSWVFVNAHETLRLWCILDIVHVEFVLFITYYPWSFIKLLALHAIAIINFLQVKLSYVVVVWDSVFLVGNCPGAIFLCGSCPVGNCPRVNYLRAIFRGRLSMGIFLSPKK